MSRFYVPPENVNDNLIFIDGQEAKHILNVMRLAEGDKVIVFDGTGKEYTGFIKDTKSKALTVEVISVVVPKNESIPKITLAQAIPKKAKMDYIVEKATELGVNTIIPILSERTIVKFEKEKENAKTIRWKKIANAAAKQCGRSDVPTVEDVEKFYNVIDRIDKYDLSLMACLMEGTISFKEALSNFKNGNIIVFIGPEGDFTPEEIEMAKETSCKFISLGKRVLKSDTAGIYALSVLNHELSE